jgi:hypothetical protein
MGGVRPGAGLGRRWALVWASDEVRSGACPVGRWDGGHAARATGVPVADGEGSMECAADADPDDRCNGRGGDRRQRVRLAAVRPVVAFLASSSGGCLSSFLAVLSLHLASVPLRSKTTLLRIGCRVTRHPRMGAAQQPEVAIWQPLKKKRLAGN